MRTARFASSLELYQALLPYANWERGQDIGRFRLDRMEALCAALGHPQRGFRSIHVAGTKGKGSVCVMLASILEEGGFKTGIYASPHVHDWRERVTRPSGPFPEASYLHAGEALMDALETWSHEEGLAALGMPTFFELMTALSFLVFKEEGCAWAVVETGLGGRLDSTNVLLPEASLITPIEKEHTEYLGDSIPLIAAEKAGIIKAGRPVFIAPMREEARRVMEEKAKALASPLESAEEACKLTEAGWDGGGSWAKLELKGKAGAPCRSLGLKTAMAGRAMLDNAALAVLCLDRLIPGLEDGAIQRGLGKARLPARFELLRRQPLLVIDGAHTPDSAALLAQTWAGAAPLGEPALLVFGCAADKDVQALAAALAPPFRRVILTRPGSFKNSDPLKAFEAFRALPSPPELLLLPDTAEAFAEAFRWRGPLLAAGSFYLASEAARLYRERAEG